MTEANHLIFDHHPSLVTPYLKGLITRRAGLKNGISLPRIQTTWKEFTINPKHLHRFMDICELPPQAQVPFEYPLTLVFPSHMHILGHSQFPLSPFSMLQTRIQIRQNRTLALNTNYSLHCQIFDRKDTNRGMNLGVCSQLCQGNELAWESINTYYFRNTRSPDADNTPIPKRSYRELPKTCEERIFKIPAKKGFAFALLSGDFNGIHYSRHYARLLGFKRDFCHAQRSLAVCLNKHSFSYKNGRVQLDAALKGPVYYDSDLLMKSDASQTPHRIDLFCADNPRPTLVIEINSDF